jgi:hypothetical protein
MAKKEGCDFAMLDLALERARCYCVYTVIASYGDAGGLRLSSDAEIE